MSVSVRRSLLRLHQFGTGRHILERLDELNRTQWLSRDELLYLQRTRLQHLVEYAYTYVPYYQRVFRSAGFSPDDLRQDPDCFIRLPVLTKSAVRANWADLLTTEPERRRRLSKLSTSGSTGQPLTFMQDTDFRDAVTADIQRHMGWAGWRLGDRQALVWGGGLKKQLGGALRTQLIDWVWNRLQLNANNMTSEAMAAFAQRVQREKPPILFGYATSLYHFARFVRQAEYDGLTFKGIFSSAERLLPAVRIFIEETFACRVFNRYGTLDVGGVACECDAHTGLHVSMENNYVEVVHDGTSAQPGVEGDIIVTNLQNRGMPFIRYSIGDVGAWHPAESCPCGRTSPMLDDLKGRLTESFQTRDGRIIRAAFSGGFRCLAHPAIKQFQVVQKSLDYMVMRLEKDGEIPQAVLDEISQAIHSTFGDNVAVEFEFVDKILPLPSGKHQYAISDLNSL